ncbi:MAG TPA: tetratricopeptide repeat protein [Vicinamibacterales bacterium]|nr:tetratricopeptide repeat protein [Vicinamibacterales bacterium]
MRLDLSPLPFPASLEIIKAVLDVESLPDALARRLHERTGGNPFFLEEMCQGLREAGIVTAHGSEAVLSAVADAIQLPDTVQAVIRSRLDRLNTDGREVLRVASVIGREFARSVLHHAMDVEDLTGPIERLKAAAIIQQVKVVPEPVYRFKHALSQEVAYESLLEHQRKSLHLAVGRAIEKCATGGFDDALEQLAYHFSRADAWEEAIHYGLRASERATELSQFGDALTLLENVHAGLLHLPDGPERRDRIADVLLGQERLCETLGLRGRQLQLSGELIALLAPNGASRRLAESYLRQGDVSTLLKRFDAADRALATALRMSRERGDAALERSALRSIGLLRWHQGRHLEALTITENALEIDREREDELAVAGDLSNLGNVLRSLGRHERALEVLEEALAMPVVAADPIKRAYILHMVASVHRTLGDVPRALGYLQEADQSALTHMLPIQRAFHLTSIAHIQLAEGRVSECLRLYQEAVELSRRARHADGLAQSLRMLGEVLFGLGREGDALPHLREAAQLFAQLEDHDGEAVIRRYTALTLERDRPADAVPEWERVRDLSQASGDAHAELSALEGIARASRRLVPGGDETVRRFEEALVLAVRLGQHAHEASLRNTLGILNFEQGRYGAALEHYEAGLRLTRGAGSGAHEGLILNSIGVTLTRLSRYEEARTVLEEALAVNGRTGEKQLEGHTLAALGTVAENTGRCDAAIACFEASLAIRREAGDRPGEGWMLHHLARTRALMGDAAGAETSLDSAARIAAECGDAALGHAIEQFASNASGVAGAQGE